LNARYRVRLVVVLALLLVSSTYGSAEPGGNGDGTRDMQCGGACHGDASLNGTSTANMQLSSETEIYEGIPTSLTLTVTGIDNGYNSLVGLFLLTDTTGHSDTPEDAGWEVLSDVNGGVNNYVEISLDSGQTEVSISWVVRASQVGTTSWYAAIHHGGSSIPYFGITPEALDVTVVEVPENLPRLSPDFSPPTVRTIGATTVFDVQTLETQEFIIEWKSDDGQIMTLNANSSATNSWQVEFPPALLPSTLQWRAVLDGEGPPQTTPWFTLVAEEASWEVSQLAVYVQAFALMFFTAGVVLVLQARFTRSEAYKQYDQTSEILPLDSTITPAAPVESQGPPIPADGLPAGWDEEQWKWYGHDYLAGKYGGEEV